MLMINKLKVDYSWYPPISFSYCSTLEPFIVRNHPVIHYPNYYHHLIPLILSYFIIIIIAIIISHYSTIAISAHHPYHHLLQISPPIAIMISFINNIH